MAEINQVASDNDEANLSLDIFYYYLMKIPVLSFKHLSHKLKLSAELPETSIFSQ